MIFKKLFPSALLPAPTLSEPLDFGSETCTLDSLAPGDAAIVAEIHSASGLRHRLLDLGFIPGTPLRALRRAPLGDPSVYEIRGMRICLRRQEAALVQVRRATGGPGLAGATR